MQALTGHLTADNLPLYGSPLIDFERPIYQIGPTNFQVVPPIFGTEPASSISRVQSHSGAQSLVVRRPATNGGVQIDGPFGEPLTNVRYLDFWIRPVTGAQGQVAVRAGNVNLSFVQVMPGYGQFFILSHNFVSSEPDSWMPMPTLPVPRGGFFPLTIPTPSTAPEQSTVPQFNVTKEWVRVTVREDLVTLKADVYLNGRLMAVNIDPGPSPTLPYLSTAANKSPLIQIGFRANPTFVDDVQVTGWNPLFQDTDNDGMPDTWEIKNHLSPVLSDRDLPDLQTEDSRYDTDHDGLEAIVEYALGTSSDNTLINGIYGLWMGRDTDNDGIGDGEEVANHMNPLDPSDAAYAAVPRAQGSSHTTIHVRNLYVSAMDGSEAKPFNSLAPAIAAAQDGDEIIVDGAYGAVSDGTTNYLTVISKFIHFRGINHASIAAHLYFYSPAYNAQIIPQLWPGGDVLDADGNLLTTPYPPAVLGNSITNIEFPGIGPEFATGCDVSITNCVFLSGAGAAAVFIWDTYADFNASSNFNHYPGYAVSAKITGCRFYDSPVLIGMTSTGGNTLWESGPQLQATFLTPPMYSVEMKQCQFNGGGSLAITALASTQFYENCCFTGHVDVGTASLAVYSTQLHFKSCTFLNNVVGIKYFSKGEYNTSGILLDARPIFEGCILWNDDPTIPNFVADTAWANQHQGPIYENTTTSDPLPPDALQISGHGEIKQTSGQYNLELTSYTDPRIKVGLVISGAGLANNTIISGLTTWSPPGTSYAWQSITLSKPATSTGPCDFTILTPARNTSDDPLFIPGTPLLSEYSSAIDCGSESEPIDILGNYRLDLDDIGIPGRIADRGAFESMGDYFIDTDGDGISDQYERLFGLNPFNPDDALEDKDSDGFSNLEEIGLGGGKNVNNSLSNSYSYSVIYVDPINGSDITWRPGTIAIPVKSIKRAIYLASLKPIAAANTTIIMLQDGTYLGADNRDWPLPSDRIIRIRSVNGPARTVVDFQNAGRAATVSSYITALDIRGVTFRNGKASGTSPDGGAILINYSAYTGTYIVRSASFTNCNFVGCTAEGSGGAVCIKAYRTVNFTQCQFLGNAASYGGSIALCAASSGFTADRSTFTYNEAKYYGGAIYSAPGAPGAPPNTGSPSAVVRLTDSTFSYNMAGPDGTIAGQTICPEGGALWLGRRVENIGIDSAGVRYARISKCDFMANSALGAGGAACVAAGNPNFVDCNFLNNIACGFAYLGTAANTLPTGCSRSGGALLLRGDTGMATTRFSRCVLRKNFTEGAGGALEGGAGKVRVSNCAILENVALGPGGGIHATSGADLTLNHNTICQNSAGTTTSPAGRLGGGLHGALGSIVSLDHSIIWRNRAKQTAIDNIVPMLGQAAGGALTAVRSNFEELQSGTGTVVLGQIVSYPPFFAQDGYHLHLNSPDRHPPYTEDLTVAPLASSSDNIRYNAEFEAKADIDHEVPTSALTDNAYCGCDLFYDSDDDFLPDVQELAIIKSGILGSTATLADVKPEDDTLGQGQSNYNASVGGTFGAPGGPPSGNGMPPPGAPPGAPSGTGGAAAPSTDEKDRDGDKVYDENEEYPNIPALTCAKIGQPNYVAIAVPTSGKTGVKFIDINNKGQVLYSTSPSGSTQTNDPNQNLDYYLWTPGEPEAVKLNDGNTNKPDDEGTDDVPNGQSRKIQTIFTVLGDDGTAAGVRNTTKTVETEAAGGQSTETDSRAIMKKPPDSEQLFGKAMAQASSLPPKISGVKISGCGAFAFKNGTTAGKGIEFLDKAGVGYGGEGNGPVGGTVFRDEPPSSILVSRPIVVFLSPPDGVPWDGVQDYTWNPPSSPTTTQKQEQNAGTLLVVTPGSRCLWRSSTITHLETREDEEAPTTGPNECPPRAKSTYGGSMQTDPKPLDHGILFHQRITPNDSGVSDKEVVFAPGDEDSTPLCMNDMAKPPSPKPTNGQAYPCGPIIGGHFKGKPCYWTRQNGKWEKGRITGEGIPSNAAVICMQDNGAMWIAEKNNDEQEGAPPYLEPKLWNDGKLKAVSELMGSSGASLVAKKVTTKGLVAAVVGTTIKMLVPFSLRRAWSDQIVDVEANGMPDATGNNNRSYVFMGARQDGNGHVKLQLGSEIAQGMQTKVLWRLAPVSAPTNPSSGTSTYESDGTTVRVTIEAGSIANAEEKDYLVVGGYDRNGDGTLTSDEMIPVPKCLHDPPGGGVNPQSLPFKFTVVSQARFASSKQNIDQLANRVSDQVPSASELLLAFGAGNPPPQAMGHFAVKISRTETGLTHPVGIKFTPRANPGDGKRWIYNETNVICQSFVKANRFKASIKHNILSHRHGEIARFFAANQDVDKTTFSWTWKELTGTSSHDCNATIGILNPFETSPNLNDLDMWLALGKVEITGTVSIDVDWPNQEISEVRFSGTVDDLYDFDYDQKGVNIPFIGQVAPSRAAEIQAGYDTLGPGGGVFLHRLNFNNPTVVPLTFDLYSL